MSGIPELLKVRCRSSAFCQESHQCFMSGAPALSYRVVFLTGPPLNFLSTGSHANWPGISLSVSSHKGIFYLENLGGVQLKKTTLYVMSPSSTSCHKSKLCTRSGVPALLYVRDPGAAPGEVSQLNLIKKKSQLCFMSGVPYLLHVRSSSLAQCSANSALFANSL